MVIGDFGNDKDNLPQFNRQLQADPNHPWQGVLQQSGPCQPRHSEQASGSEGGDTSQDQGPLRLQELEAGACHHGKAEPPHHCLLSQGCLFDDFYCLVLGGSLCDSIGGLQAAGGDRQAPPDAAELPAQQEHREHPSRCGLQVVLELQ